MYTNFKYASTLSMRIMLMKSLIVKNRIFAVLK